MIFMFRIRKKNFSYGSLGKKIEAESQSIRTTRLFPVSQCHRPQPADGPTRIPPHRAGHKNLVSIDDWSRGDIENLLDVTEDICRHPGEFAYSLAGSLVCTAFFEPSTRTRLSFEAAAHRLGAKVLSMGDMQTTRMGLGESASDTLRMAGYYADLVVARHAQDGMVERMAQALDVPVVNAGEGVHRHPTQTLIDLFTMRKHFGTLDGLRVGICGGLRYSRAAKSLLAGLRAFRDVRVHVVDAVGDADEAQPVPLAQVVGAGAQEHACVADMLGQVDVLYVVRVQREQFRDAASHGAQLERCRVDRRLLQCLRGGMVVMHCLPRGGELPEDVDDTPFNHYFRQAANGVAVRMAVLQRYLGRFRLTTAALMGDSLHLDIAPPSSAIRSVAW
ncbi:aspartate carbamoyltransferase [Paracidovorax citrulli]|nr:aspartate carbamoyltransferase [Paracidovorax citrulli]REG69736.1 aspartate carbamoyltransferase [Paracidovorax citrulli]RLJ94290.1 aspartate carbamoyltransferase [Paracidovorax citrulli]UMT86435.1 aspartate carbamoyltransferase [Paracidovorax citrulli]